MIFKVFSVQSLIYLLLSICLSIGLLYLLDWERFSKLADKKWNKTWGRAISIFSQVMILILILDETCLLLKEWGIEVRFFNLFRKILEIPGVNKLVLLASLGLVIPAAQSLTLGLIDQVKEKNISRLANWEDFHLYKRKYSLMTSLIVLEISLIIFLLQCALHEEFQFAASINSYQSLGYFLLLCAGPVTVLFRIITRIRRLSKTHCPYREQPWFEKEMFFVNLLFFFLSLTQTMITKVLLLLTVVSWAGPEIKRLIGYLLPKVKSRDVSGSQSAYNGIIKGLSDSSLIRRLNFIFLTISFLPIMLLFQFHNSPYPPFSSAFPKTETVSALYMLYIILFLFIGTNEKGLAFRSVLWASITIFILYVTPIVCPSLYFPSVDPPGLSLFDIAAEASDIWVPSLFLFTVHIIVWFLSALLYYIISIKSELIQTKYQSVRLFKKYSLILFHLADLFVFVLYPIFFLMLIKSDAYKVSEIIDRDAVSTANTISLIMIILACLGLLFVKIRRIKLLKDETLEVGGEDVNGRLTNEWKLLGTLRSWSGKRNRLRGYLFLFVPYLVLVLVTVGILYLPEKCEKQKTQLLWSIEVKDEETPYFHLLEKVDDRIIFSSSRGLACHDPATGTMNWTIPVQIIDAEINSIGKVIALTRGSVMSIGIDSGEITWESVFDTNVINNHKPFDIVVIDDVIAVKGNDYISVLDEFTGQEIKVTEDFILPAIHDFNGSFYWLTSNNHLQKFNSDLTTRDLIQIQDSVIEYYSYPNSLIIRTENGISVLDDSGNLLWERQFEPEEDFYRMYLSDTLLFMEFRNEIKTFSLITSREKWGMKGRFMLVGWDGFSVKNVPFSASLPDGVFATDDQNLFFIEKNSGTVLKVFKNALSETSFGNYILGNTNNTMALVGPLALNAYSFEDTRRLYDDFYSKAIIAEDPEYFETEPENIFLPHYILLQYGIVFDMERMYVLNPYGLVALRIRNY